MVKYEVARWLTPGLTPMRLAFTSYGGSAHGEIHIECQDVDTGEWHETERLGTANGIPSSEGQKVGEQHINQFTGSVVDD